ncbi:MAG: hypothetical protein JW793_11630 [Acidobacteria bacterium]|nr:hypothetical protein [Acidobacteriota bacterium]
MQAFWIICGVGAFFFVARRFHRDIDEQRAEMPVFEVSTERQAVKRYESEKAVSAEGTWRHLKVTLKPNNPEFKPITLTCEDEGSVRVIAEMIEVII